MTKAPFYTYLIYLGTIAIFILVALVTTLPTRADTYETQNDGKWFLVDTETGERWELDGPGGNKIRQVKKPEAKSTPKPQATATSTPTMTTPTPTSEPNKGTAKPAPTPTAVVEIPTWIRVDKTATFDRPAIWTQEVAGEFIEFTLELEINTNPVLPRVLNLSDSVGSGCTLFPCLPPPTECISEEGWATLDCNPFAYLVKHWQEGTWACTVSAKNFLGMTIYTHHHEFDWQSRKWGREFKIRDFRYDWNENDRTKGSFVWQPLKAEGHGTFDGALGQWVDSEMTTWSEHSFHPSAYGIETLDFVAAAIQEEKAITRVEAVHSPNSEYDQWRPWENTVCKASVTGVEKESPEDSLPFWPWG